MVRIPRTAAGIEKIRRTPFNDLTEEIISLICKLEQYMHDRGGSFDQGKKWRCINRLRAVAGEVAETPQCFEIKIADGE